MNLSKLLLAFILTFIVGIILSLVYPGFGTVASISIMGTFILHELAKKH